MSFFDDVDPEIRSELDEMRRVTGPRLGPARAWLLAPRRIDAFDLDSGVEIYAFEDDAIRSRASAVSELEGLTARPPLRRARRSFEL